MSISKCFHISSTIASEFIFLFGCFIQSNIMDFWQQFENCPGQKFPPCVIKLLKECGYNSFSTIIEFSETDVEYMEQFINENLKYVLTDLKCCNAISYQKQTKFKFLPAHRNLILNLKSRMSSIKMSSENSSKLSDQSTIENFALLLQTLFQKLESQMNCIVPYCFFFIVHYINEKKNKKWLKDS